MSREPRSSWTKFWLGIPTMCRLSSSGPSCSTRPGRGAGGHAAAKGPRDGALRCRCTLSTRATLRNTREARRTSDRADRVRPVSRVAGSIDRTQPTGELRPECPRAASWWKFAERWGVTNWPTCGSEPPITALAASRNKLTCHPRTGANRERFGPPLATFGLFTPVFVISCCVRIQTEGSHGRQTVGFALISGSTHVLVSMATTSILRVEEASA